MDTELYKLKNLIAGQYYWVKKVQELKVEGAKEFQKCKRDLIFDNCLDVAHNELKEFNISNPEIAYGFEDWWKGDGDTKFEPCVRCIKGREIKKDRVAASKRLGSIKGTLTKIGMKLDYVDPNQNKE